MPEPVSTTTAAGAVGVSALLIGWLGPVGADVMLVIMSAMAGCVVALSGVRCSWVDSFKFISAGVLLSLVTAWGIASLVSSFNPALSGPYAPSIVAFCIGAILDRLPALRKTVIRRAELTLGKGESNG